MLAAPIQKEVFALAERLDRARFGQQGAIVSDADAALRPPAVQFQDYQVRCRMAGLARA